MPGRTSDSGMIGSPAAAAGAPGTSAASTVTSRIRPRIRRATYRPARAHTNGNAAGQVVNGPSGAGLGHGLQPLEQVRELARPVLAKLGAQALVVAHGHRAQAVEELDALVGERRP